MTDVYVDQHIATDQISWPTMAHNTFKLGNMIIFPVYSTSTRPGEGAIYRYLSRQGKIAGDIHETKSSGLSLSWSPRALARGGSTKIN